MRAEDGCVFGIVHSVNNNASVCGELAAVSLLAGGVVLMLRS